MLSPATLPGNWGTSMVMEYGITSFALAGHVGHGTSIWFVDTTRQKSCIVAQHKSMPTRDKRDRRNTSQKNHKVWMVPSANATNSQCCSCAINYPVLPPNTAYNSNIQSTSLQYSPFPTLLPPYKDSTPNLSTHIRRKSWLGCTTCIFHWAVLFQLLSK